MLLVRDVTGPAQAVAGSTATYRVTSFNIADPPAEEVRQINWRIESDGESVAEFRSAGGILDFDVPASLIGKTIRVMPFRNSPTPVVSVVSRVISADGVNAAASNLIVLPRADWGPKPLPRLGAIINRSVRTQVFIHHTDVVDHGSTPNEWESLDDVKSRMRDLQTIREDDLGADVPYSIVAFCMSNGDLVLCEGRGVDRLGAHTKGHNTRGIGIAFQGNFEPEDTPLPAQLDAHAIALGIWLRTLREQEGFVNLGSDHPAGREVFAHQDVKSTDCPGRHLIKRLPLIRFL